MLVMANPKNTEFDDFVKRQQELAAEAATEVPFDPKKSQMTGSLN
jgi:hypothetical protein